MEGQGEAVQRPCGKKMLSLRDCNLRHIEEGQLETEGLLGAKKKVRLARQGVGGTRTHLLISKSVLKPGMSCCHCK